MYYCQFVTTILSFCFLTFRYIYTFPLHQSVSDWMRLNNNNLSSIEKEFSLHLTAWKTSFTFLKIRARLFRHLTFPGQIINLDSRLHIKTIHTKPDSFSFIFYRISFYQNTRCHKIFSFKNGRYPI